MPNSTLLQKQKQNEKTENQKEKKKKNENIKRELARTASDDSKRWQRHLFNFDLVLFHLIRTVDTARRVDDGWTGGKETGNGGRRHFFHLYTREITQKLSKHCRCAAGLIENDSGSWVRHAKSNCTHCAYAAWHTQHLCLLAGDAASGPRMHAIIIASSLNS